MGMCSYQGCFARRVPFSSTTFFCLPTDSRRSKWIANSGNPDLKNLKPNQLRFFCERHFAQQDIRKQFNRKMLNRHAVPKPFKYADEVVPNKISKSKKVTNPSPAEAAATADNANDEDELYYQENIVYDSATSSEDEEMPPTSDECFETQTPLTITRLQKGTLSTKTNNVVQKEPAYKAIDVCDGSALVSYESDKHYALSLVQYFQRLRPKTRDLAKVKILSYLTELAHGEHDANL